LEVLSQTPNTFETWANLGQLECDSGRFEQAAEILARAVDLDPAHAQTHWWRGLALGKLDRWDEARRHFETAAALAPNKPAMWQGLLSATTALQDLEGSLSVVERALELQPGNKSLMAVQADVSRVLGRR
jgi:tetratricopeptide (TPR) repeat protein